jgi:hypothetical protein
VRLTEEEHMTVTGAARLLGRPASMFSGRDSVLSRYRRGGIAAVMRSQGIEARPRLDLTARIEGLGWFVPAARFFYLNTNATADRGSLPESIRRTISLPHLPVGWTEGMRGRFLRAIQAGFRVQEGKDLAPGMVPEDGSGRVELGIGRVLLRDEAPHETPAPVGESGAAAPQSKTRRVPVCPEDLREELLEREREGKAFVPERIARQITRGLSKAVVRMKRNPTEAGLDFLNASGSLFFFNDPVTGERRPPRRGEVIEADDATINFPVCVPWTLGGDPCSDRWGVKVGRFQWLVSVDARTRYVTAWTYVMRPRSSYRAEDALALMRAHCVAHGIPLVWRFEQGVWKSNLVQHAIRGMRSHLHTVWSPHQKPFIEGLFNTLWTKLSVQFPGADVGRFQGETEAANDLLVSCQRGARDPRSHFPMLATALEAFREAIGEKNRTPVRSEVGSWVPGEVWERGAESGESGAAAPHSKALDAGSEWLFMPQAKEWTVRGMLVGGRVPVFEDLSVPFDFSAPWLAEYDGAKVRVHFDPAAPRCRGTIVLLSNWSGKKAGEVLGEAGQINEVAGYARLVLGWGDDPTNAGRLARQRASAGLRREVRAVMGTAQKEAKGYVVSEERDGVAGVIKIERGAEGGPRPEGRMEEEAELSERLERARIFEEENLLG